MKRGVHRIQNAKVDRIHVDCRTEKKMVRTKTQIHRFVVVRISSVFVCESVVFCSLGVDCLQTQYYKLVENTSTCMAVCSIYRNEEMNTLNLNE